jgi:hypothetical protein
MKSLLHFGKDDVAKWEHVSARKARAWQERNDWFAAARKVLDEAGAATVADLPAAKIQELAEHAERVWKKAQGGTPKT